MRELLQKLIAVLPRCDDCGKPATRIGDDGDDDDCTHLCDECRPDQQLWDSETPEGNQVDGTGSSFLMAFVFGQTAHTKPLKPGETRWAAAMREAIAALEEGQ